MPVQAKAAIWFAICSIITKCISMITVPIFTRLMTTDQYGVYSVYNSWLQMVTVIATLRLDYSVFNKGMSKYPKERDAYTVSMQTFTTLVVAGLAIAYLPFADVVNAYTGLSTVITLMMLLEIVFSSAVSYWMTRRRYEYKYHTIILATLFISIGNALLGVAAVLLFEQKDVARIASVVLIYCIVGTVIYVVNIRRGGRLVGWGYVKYALAFNLPLLPHYAAMYVIDSFDRIMIQAMVGFSAAAIYSVACALGNALKIVTNSINNAIVPWMYEMMGAGEFKKLGKTTSLVILIPVIPVLLLVLVGPEVVWLFGGDAYAEASYVLAPIAEALVFSFCYIVLANIEFFFDKNRFVMFVSLIASAANIALNYVFIAIFGYLAAAYTTLGCYVFIAICHFFYVRVLFQRKGMDSPFSARLLGGAGLGLILVGVFITLLYPYPVVRYAVFFVAMVVLFIKRKRLIAFLRKIKKKKQDSSR